jgi:cob(I)alamin adenosyltransferase
MAFKIYTKTGDKGETGLFGGARVPKSHIRVETYGTVDELNSYIGLLSDLITPVLGAEVPPQYGATAQRKKEVLKEIQDRLFTIGSVLASDPDKNMMTPDVTVEDIQLLENEIDAMDAELPPLKNFILPGGHSTVSFCNIARTVCRRAERLIIALNTLEKQEGREIDPLIIQYINRLSDYLFILGRKIANELGVEEIIWKPR